MVLTLKRVLVWLLVLVGFLVLLVLLFGIGWSAGFGSGH